MSPEYIAELLSISAEIDRLEAQKAEIEEDYIESLYWPEEY